MKRTGGDAGRGGRSRNRRSDSATTRDKGPLAADVVRFVFLGLVVATPWALGGVQASVQVLIYAGVLIALVGWLIALTTGRQVKMSFPLAAALLVVANGLALLQVTPLPGRVHQFLSPSGARLKNWLVSAPGEPKPRLADLHDQSDPKRSTLSIYPASTRRDLASLTLGTICFFLGTRFFQSRRSQLWLCGVAAVNGAALAFFGLVQQLSWNGRLYWTIPMTGGGSPFGPFVNRNNAGGYLTMCLAGAIGLLVWSVSLSAGARRRQSVAQAMPPRTATLLARLRTLVANLNALQVSALGLTGCVVAGVLCSLSRGAFLGMVGATAFTVLAMLFTRRSTLQVWLFGLGALAGLGLVGWVGLTDTVQTRLATLLHQETPDGRIPHWRDAMHAAADFRSLGSGLGTYRYVYGLYQVRLAEEWFYHAENQYLEALVEGGIVGLGLMVAMIVLVAAAIWRLLVLDAEKHSHPFALVGVFALSSQAIHALFDFGLYVPANMLLFSALCGALVGRAAVLGNGRRFSSGLAVLPPVKLMPLSPVLVTALLIAGGWGLLETRQVAAQEAALKEVPRLGQRRAISTEQLEQARDRLTAALRGRWDDAESHWRLAEVLIRLYRIRSFDRLCSELGRGPENRRLWEFTDPAVLHFRTNHFRETGNAYALEQLRNEPVVRENLVPALQHLLLARKFCPFLPQVHLRLAELWFLQGDPSIDGMHLVRARRLAPGDPVLLFRGGLLDLNAGREKTAYESWRKCSGLTDRYEDRILALASERLGVAELVEAVLPDSPQLLVRLARQRYASEEKAQHLLVERAEQLINQVDLPEEEWHYLRGSLYALKNQLPLAVQSYGRALALRPKQVRWRYELAMILRQQGLSEDAHEQAKWCVRQDPSSTEFRRLLQEINLARLLQ